MILNKKIEKQNKSEEFKRLLSNRKDPLHLRRPKIWKDIHFWYDKPFFPIPVLKQQTEKRNPLHLDRFWHLFQVMPTNLSKRMP